MYDLDTIKYQDANIKIPTECSHILKPARSKRNSRQSKTHVDPLLLQLVDDILSMCDADSFLDRAEELVKKAIDKHAYYNTAELDRSRPVKRGAATRRRLGEQVAVNTHTMGTSFVGKVRNVRQTQQKNTGQHICSFRHVIYVISGLKAHLCTLIFTCL